MLLKNVENLECIFICIYVDIFLSNKNTNLPIKFTIKTSTSNNYANENKN